MLPALVEAPEVLGTERVWTNLLATRPVIIARAAESDRQAAKKNVGYRAPDK